jgi:hypothetical protein
MDCPRCKLTNPEPAQRCDCGYDFVKAAQSFPKDEALNAQFGLKQYAKPTTANTHRYLSAEEVRAEVEKREHDRLVKAHRADEARKDDWRMIFGFLLFLIAIVFLVYGVYAGNRVTWDVRAADMTPAINFQAFLAALPGLALGLMCGRIAWAVMRPR